jgi:hypothetical protein
MLGSLKKDRKGGIAMSDKDEKGKCVCSNHGRVECPACRGAKLIKIGASIKKGAVEDVSDPCGLCKGVGTVGKEEVALIYEKLKESLILLKEMGQLSNKMAECFFKE